MHPVSFRKPQVRSTVRDVHQVRLRTALSQLLIIPSYARLIKDNIYKIQRGYLGTAMDDSVSKSVSMRIAFNSIKTWGSGEKWHYENSVYESIGASGVFVDLLKVIYIKSFNPILLLRITPLL